MSLFMGLHCTPLEHYTLQVCNTHPKQHHHRNKRFLNEPLDWRCILGLNVGQGGCHLLHYLLHEWRDTFVLTLCLSLGSAGMRTAMHALP